MGFRNGIVHEYGKTDYVIVYETATQDIDELRELFMALLLRRYTLELHFRF